ncbi:hypothetical protein BX616_003622 [Lobosporangium transversale]|uniref:C2H2-type domain-containing protein n=1 Tax=Lobosporangium transversale TaxID=64571 RepID=A0A1Y2GCG0_9FUNG|nr:hypothetical protein BCR41DRAFT_360471 [Lobosporangium transversale]KAF9898778.1 hypothetical protein BX616_003622 [Lobosporangium transversale]ORZ07002.1 hypothetical protein BCR41DRAFT_360471 [Lobosporangium transversale]|eukprot:XP_021877798.1 hypothetical protein BCR41DRAFT_360471 [Lobosporangium transversale]
MISASRRYHPQSELPLGKVDDKGAYQLVDGNPGVRDAVSYPDVGAFDALYRRPHDNHSSVEEMRMTYALFPELSSLDMPLDPSSQSSLPLTSFMNMPPIHEGPSLFMESNPITEYSEYSYFLPSSFDSNFETIHCSQLEVQERTPYNFFAAPTHPNNFYPTVPVSAMASPAFTTGDENDVMDVSTAATAEADSDTEMEADDETVFSLKKRKKNRLTSKTTDQRRRKEKAPKVYTCEYPGCNHGKPFKRLFNLQQHLKTHSQVKPFQCDAPGCVYASIRRGDLKRHLRGHTGETPYGCPVENCMMRFQRVEALTRHRARDH